MYLLRNTYYPSLIIQNGYCSRNIPSVESYKAVYDRRIAAKHSPARLPKTGILIRLFFCIKNTS